MCTIYRHHIIEIERVTSPTLTKHNGAHNVPHRVLFLAVVSGDGKLQPVFSKLHAQYATDTVRMAAIHEFDQVAWLLG